MTEPASNLPQRDEPRDRLDTGSDAATGPADDSGASFDLLDDDKPDQGFAESGPPARDEARGVWFLALADGREEGPLTLAEMERRIRGGQVRPLDVVWREGLHDWLSASTVEELKPFFPASADPQSPPPYVGAGGYS
ncbi:MAG: DUF4339 domain-containing protein, partial [Planctomycetaceae bacterium]